ncbi:hypothetical protein QUF80_10660 [Desulfococcaceae bacterium HSG8]|nr:hypothetical protein [Desulfococcaceae bacterium HSG8]
MEVSMHYRGRLSDTRKIRTMCDELIGIAARMNWEWISLDEDWSVPANATVIVSTNGAEIDGYLSLKGVGLTVDADSDPLQFFFDSQGNLRDPLSQIMITEGHMEPENAWVSVKTQPSSPETHIRIVALLKYLKKYYIPDLQVFDEGEYWETGDIEILREKMDFTDDKTESVSGAFLYISREHVSKYSDEELILMIEGLLREKFDTETRVIQDVADSISDSSD